MTVEQRPLTLKETKQKQIEAIIAQDRQNFEGWLSTKKTTSSQDKAIRYLIPPRVFEVAEDPKKVHVRIAKGNESLLKFFIIEEKPKPLTDINIFKRLPDNDIFYIDDVPGVDRMHYLSSDEVRSGLIKTTDFIFNRLALLKNGTSLQVLDYMDRKEMRQKGIATSFYKRLEEVASESGFKYIIGENNPKNKSFFINHLGRTALAELPTTIIKEETILYDKYKRDPNSYTVTVLSGKNSS